jgi:hypothetical protein
MDVYIAFTKKQNERIHEWKTGLPKSSSGKRLYGIEFEPTEEQDEEGHKLFRASMKSNDGHIFLVTKKAAFHT